MGRETHSGRNQWSLMVQTKLRELAELISREKYGADGPPLELTFSEIEEVGHEVGRLAATEVDQTVQRQHAKHFNEAHTCPGCGRLCTAAVKQRELVTRDGPAELEEPACYCNACERSFFPSACHTEDRRSTV